MSFRAPLFGLFLVISLLLPAGCLHPRPPRVVTGTLDGDMTWSGEVHLAGDVTLGPGAHLTIRPGSTIRFLPPAGFPGELTDHPHFPGSELIVRGRLTAIGTSAAPITFQALDDAAPAGSWGAVNFMEGGEGDFRYSIFRHADSAVHAWSARVSIEESLFERNLVGIRFNSSRMRIENNLLRNNGAAIRFHFGEPVVRSNRFTGNQVNLFITSHPRDYLFENNLFGAPLDYHVVLGEEVPEDVQLAKNGWEGAPATGVNNLFFDGRRVPYIGLVQIEPVLTAAPEGVGPSWSR